jgi:hypothetical protein
MHRYACYLILQRPFIDIDIEILSPFNRFSIKEGGLTGLQISIPKVFADALHDLNSSSSTVFIFHLISLTEKNKTVRCNAGILII